MTTYSATYSAEDDKIRLRASARLDAETYARVKAAGFGWAPKQDLFYAVWTPAREDLAIELAGDIEDESTSLEDRAAQRAERFEEYRGKRAQDAERARAGVAAIADGIPLGQPILVGHHSERHARRDAERIQNGMRKAVQMWETSTYWASRAAGALAHAERHEVPAVRARRIKTLEADQRKAQRDLAESEKRIRVWSDDTIKHKDGSPTTLAERVAFLARIGAGCSYDLQGKLERGELTPEAAQASVIAAHEASAAHERRWISHLENRLVYERALLAESGYTPPPKPKSKADLPILNYAGRVSYRTRWSRDVVECETTPLTKAEYAKIGTDYKGTVVSSCGTHRLRTALLRDHAYHVIVLTDSKQHERPCAAAVAAQAEEDEAAREVLLTRKTEAMRARIEANKARESEREQDAQEAAPFEAIKDALRAGVQVVVAPQLFPTPPALAARMVDLAGIEAGDRVLEPSAGTGNIAKAIRQVGVEAVCVEINPALAKTLADAGYVVHLADFLHWEPVSAVQEVASRATEIRVEEILQGTETWKPVVGYETVYEVSSWGRLRRLITVKGYKAGDFVHGAKRTDGYVNVMLCKGGKATARLMHQIVMDAFIGPCPVGKEINHRHPDGDKTRNWLSNLEYTTSPANNRDQIERRPSNYSRGDAHPRAKLTEAQIPSIKERIRNGESNTSIAESFGVTSGTISAIASGKTWRDPLLFDKIIANPPFGRAADVEHIRHALKLLRPAGGCLVAICANGPRQQAELRPLATTWEELPEGTFADQGTHVRTVLMTVQR